MNTPITLMLILAIVAGVGLVWILATLWNDRKHERRENDRHVEVIKELCQEIDELKEAQYSSRHSHLETEYLENDLAMKTRALYEYRTAYELIAEAILRMGQGDKELIKAREKTQAMRQKPNGGKR